MNISALFPVRTFSGRILSFLFFSLYFSVTAQDRKIDSLKLALANVKEDTTQCNILAILSEIADDNEWPAFNAELMRICENKLKSIKSSDPKTVFFTKHLANAYNNVGYLFNNEGNSEKAIEFISKALTLQEKLNLKAQVANTLHSLGAVYQRKNNLIKALELYEKSKKISEEINNPQGIIFCLNQIGSVLINQGNIVKGISYYESGLKLAEKENDKAGLASSLYNIALLYSKQDEKTKGFEYAKRSLKISEELKDKAHVAFSVNLLGGLCLETRQSIEALRYFTRGLKLNEEMGDKRSIAMSYGYMGAVSMQLNDQKEALSFFEKSLALSTELKDKGGMSKSLDHIGLIHLQRHDNGKALECFDNAMKYALEIGYPVLIKEAAQNLDRVYKSKGDFKKAYDYNQLYIRMKDSLENEETKKASIKTAFTIEYAKMEHDLKSEQEKKNLIYEKEKIQKQADLEKQRAISYSFMGGIILLVVLAFVIFKNLRQSKAANKTITEQKQAVELQKSIVEEKQKEIVDSINYARRIQYTLLAQDDFLKKNIADHFVFFKPKAIVSGDFYWATRKNDNFYIAVCDSTGHGVPGAFMSLLSISFLNEAINERNIVEPNKIFDHVRDRLIENMSKEDQKDGFDGILFCFNDSSKKITYAAANNYPILISNSSLTELEADKMPVGIGEKKQPFNLFTLNAEKGSTLYLYTDGYADQFGGPKGKKFKYKPLNELLISNSSRSFEEQKITLKSTFENWQGNLEQVDDVCIIGVRI